MNEMGMAKTTKNFKEQVVRLEVQITSEGDHC